MYRDILRPIAFRFSPETAHDLGLASLRAATPLLALRGAPKRHIALQQRLWGMDFPSPVGLAAGLDKNGHCVSALAALGFGHVEIGTITAYAQPGNPQPRLFRLPLDEGIINRMGFNNRGSEEVAVRLARWRESLAGREWPTILGINLGKSKITPLESAADDYAQSVQRLAPFADYIVVNVSSPNTPGLRDLQGEAFLAPLLRRVRQEIDRIDPRIPLLLKIAPDLAEEGIDAAVDAAIGTGCDGIIATNTTIARDGLVTSEATVTAIGNGGLSGRPVFTRSTAALARAARRLRAHGRADVPIIGVGGIDSAEAAWAKIVHGASLVQIYSALIYRGPVLIREIEQGLLRLLRQHGYTHLRDAIGSAL